jgi:membrane protein
MSILDALRGISGYSGGEVRPSLRKIWPGLGSLCAGGEHTVDVKTVRHLFSESFTKWSDDDAPSLGAALAFYTILSMSPLVIFVVAIAQALLMAQVQSLIGASGRDAIAMMLANGQRHWHGLFSSSLGFLTLIFGASGVFGELRSALNKIWKAKPRAASSLMILARGRLFSFGMVVSVGFVLLVSLIASTGLAAMTKYFSGVLPFPAIFWEALNFLVSFAGVTVLFALILKYVPETKIAWEDVRLGAVFTALLAVSWARQPGLALRSRRIGGGGGDLGVLLCPDLLFRRRIDPCIRDVAPQNGAGRGLSIQCCGLSATQRPSSSPQQSRKGSPPSARTVLQEF